MNSNCFWNDKGSLRFFKLTTVAFCSFTDILLKSSASKLGIGTVYAFKRLFPSLGLGSARSFYAMFDGCNSINNLDLSKWNTQNVYTVSWMFSGTFKLTNLKGIENWNVQNVKYIEYWFHNCGLSEIKLPDLTKNDISSIRHLFSGANNITEIDLTKIDMNKVTDLKETFAYCNKLKTIYVRSDYIGGKSTDTFIDCTSLVGGAGTKYDPTFIDSTGARIDGGPSNPGYFTAISDKPLETPQTNESDMNEATCNEVRSVETPAKEPDELETDSKQNESESQQ